MNDLDDPRRDSGPVDTYFTSMLFLHRLAPGLGEFSDSRSGLNLQSRAAALDRVKQKLAPRGELSAAHKRPPCDSTIERQIRSPMPVP
jgi:hypothetical protein